MNTKSFMVFTRIIEYIIKYFRLVVVFAAVLILLSGIYRVESNEAAVVLRFGRLAGKTLQRQVKNPGLHFALPFFIDEVIKVPVQTMHERNVTTHFVPGRRAPNTRFVDGTGYLLTGDNNVVHIWAKVIYQIQNPVQYAIYSVDAGQVVDGVVSGELTRLVTHMDIDTVLTIGRAQMSSALLLNSQVILDGLKTGIAIAAIELTEIIPPSEIIRYFEEVRTAAITKETLIRQARETGSTMIINAQAQARAYRQTAISDHNVRLSQVYDRMAEFNGIYDLYRINPQLIISGNFRERAARIIAQSGGSVIVPNNSESPIILLP